MAKFVVKTAQNGEPYWHFIAKNGRFICWSGETFSSMQALLDNIEFVKTNSKSAPVERE